MSYTCRNCGTTIMEDDENLCSKCKPAESAPAARDEGWSMASIHRELSEAAERSRPVTLSAAEARTVLDTLAAEGRRRGGGEMSDNWHGWIDGVEFTSRESALKALGISEPAPTDEDKPSVPMAMLTPLVNGNIWTSEDIRVHVESFGYAMKE